MWSSGAVTRAALKTGQVAVDAPVRTDAAAGQGLILTLCLTFAVKLMAHLALSAVTRGGRRAFILPDIRAGHVTRGRGSAGCVYTLARMVSASRQNRLYPVRGAAQALRGAEAAPRDVMHLDVWGECHLEFAAP